MASFYTLHLSLCCLKDCLLLFLKDSAYFLWLFCVCLDLLLGMGKRTHSSPFSSFINWIRLLPEHILNVLDLCAVCRQADLQYIDVKSIYCLSFHFTKCCPFTCCVHVFPPVTSACPLLHHANQEIQDGHNGYPSDAEVDQVASFTHLLFNNCVIRSCGVGTIFLSPCLILKPWRIILKRFSQCFFLRLSEFGFRAHNHSCLWKLMVSYSCVF